MSNKSVELPESLVNRVESRIKGSKFASVSDYVTFVLREKLAEEESPKTPFSEEEEKKIKDRLRALGYL